MSVAMTFEDREISGASIVNRLGFLSLIRAAKARLFDVIVAKGLDRLFRDHADYHTARKRFDFLGITIDESEADIVRGFFANLSKAGRRGQLPRRSMPIGVKAPPRRQMECLDRGRQHRARPWHADKRTLCRPNRLEQGSAT